tara:strand:- start:40 stop:711 length:672 start_codon:yes stop_codon:yes gene_type:complete
MHQRKGKKILVYLFLLILVGSINNIKLNNLKLKNIDYINVTGLEDNNNIILRKKIENLNLENILLINAKQITNLINSNSLIEKYIIFKRYPSSIDIKIEKTKFLAKIKKDGKIFYLGSNGKLSKNIFIKNDLPFIFGKPDIREFLQFKKTIDQSKISYAKIKNLYFYPSKRWDLEIEDNVIIKLPNINTKETLDVALDFLYNNKLKNIKTIDVRVKDQIILND